MGKKKAEYPDDPVTAFSVAVYRSDLAAMRRFLRQEPRAIDKLAKARLPEWIVCEAAKKSTPEALRLLIELGADVNQQDSNENTGLCFAIRRDRYEIAKMLLEFGADPDLGFPLREVAVNMDENADRVAMARLLLDAGADVNQAKLAWGKSLRSALSWALACGHEELAAFLRSRGAELPGALSAGGASASREGEAEDYIDYGEKILAHFAKHRGRPEPGAIREIVPSSDPPVDVHYIPFDEKNDRPACLFTVGLSRRKMAVPAGAEAYPLAELFVKLPRDWPAPRAALKDPRYSWPIRWLRKIAAYPREHHTWLGAEWTVLANDDPPEPLGEGTQFTAWAMLSPDDKEHVVKVSKKVRIQLYHLFPLYTEEYLLERREGFEGLLERFDKHPEVSRAIVVSRPNVALEE